MTRSSDDHQQNGGARVRWLRHPQHTRERITHLAGKLAERLYGNGLAPACLDVAGPAGRISWDEAMALSYRPAALGEHFGPRWATHWFRCQWDVPAAWRDGEIFLRWNSHSEAALWRDGVVLGGLNPGPAGGPFGHQEIRLRDVAGTRLELHVEMACNGEFGIDATPGMDRPINSLAIVPFWLETCELCLRDGKAWELWHDLEVLRQLEADRTPPQFSRSFGGALPLVRPALETAWAGKLLCELNRFCNAFDVEDPATWPAAHALLKPLLAVRNGGATHELSAIGHAHIDTAWLWPLAETYRKCLRSFSTAVAYMDEYPDYRFACSQAYQYQQVEQRQPELFARIRRKVEAGQWQVVGGTWIEPDCNIPSGESLCRQFLHGQRYFEERFGRRCSEFWNPDVFGYNGQLPQIMRHAGIRRFLTQKLSWNRFTQPQHHTFFWRGIDGSEVLTHFPPADTYNGTGEVSELRYHAANYKEADRGAEALYLFGCGDGGGGPTRAMLETLGRVGDLQGVPRAMIRAPAEFFDRLDSNTYAIPSVVGELYMEGHRGTFTTQAELKRLNRRCEEALHDLEFLQAAARHVARAAVDGSGNAALWQTLLLHQFHDILPGSSITQVNREARAALAELLEAAEHHVGEAARVWLGEGREWRPVNTVGMERREMARHPGGGWAAVYAPAYGAGKIVGTDQTAVLRREGDGLVLENAFLRAVLDAGGGLRSLLHKPSGRETIAGVGNDLVLYRDEPLQLDAWDIEPPALETGRSCPPAESFEIVDEHPLRVAVVFRRRVGKASVLEQTVSLDALSPSLTFDTAVEWRERHRLLKAEFPVTVRNSDATYEIQFGAVQRPTHGNTQADVARFEVPGHRWSDLSEAGFGVSLMTDSKYGYAVQDNRMTVSLLRAPTYPDAEADQGAHRFRYALYPHAGDWRAAGTPALARAFNQPLRWVQAADGAPSQPLFQVDQANVVIDTVKPAEDGRGVVVRLYEAHGRTVQARLTTVLECVEARESNIMEDDLGPLPLEGGRHCRLEMRPYQLRTIRFDRHGGSPA
jgi:alpha-mannosidase